MHPYAVAGFLASVFPLIATPGASLALLIQQVTEEGRRQALPVILGTAGGLYVHATLAIAGLATMAVHSGLAFAAVRFGGAAYLIGLGVWTWRSARAGPAADRPGRAASRRPGPALLQALLANVLNPKAASIYLTLVPQFLDPHQPLAGQILTLASAHALLVAGWLLAWTVLIGRTTQARRQPWLRYWGTRATAVVLLAMGIHSLA